MISPSHSGPDPLTDADLADAFGFDLDDESWVDRLRTCASAPVMGRLGDFELLSELGRGGQGVVFKARQPRTGRIVAVKRLGAGVFATPAMRSRFEREVETASALDHPNIVTVFGSEIVDGQAILAMQWIDGEPVDRWAAGSTQHRRPPDEILSLFAKICDAVHHAHQRGVIHRDIKPSNVLIDADHNPHVLDFGLARLFSPFENDLVMQSYTTGFVGTPAYASPEHFSNDTNEVDVRSDIYSLGAMLYQALTGRPPFADRQRFTELARAVEHVDPPKPSRVQPGLGHELDAIVLKTLAKSKTDRYQSMDALTEDINRYLSGQPVLAHPPSAFYQFGKLVRRNKLAFASAAGFLVLIAAFSVTATVLAVREHTAKKDANWNSYVASIAAASAALRANDAASAQQYLERAPPNLRDWEWRYFRRQSDGSDVSTRLESQAVAINDAGELVASVAAGLPSMERAVATGRASILTRTHNRRTDLSSGLRWAMDGGGRLIHRPSGRQVGQWPFPAHYSTCFAPNERTLAIANQGGELKLVSLPESVSSLKGGADDSGISSENDLPLDIQVLQLFTMTIEGLAFRPDSRLLATSAGDGAIVIVDVPTAKVVDRLPGNGSAVWAVAFSPDGRSLAAGSWDKSVTLWDIESKQAIWKGTGHRELISALAFSPDGSRLASGSWDRTVRVWDTAGGEYIAQLVGHTHEVGTVAFLGGSEKLASFDADGVLKQWTVTTGNRSIVSGPFRRIEGLAGSLGSIRAGWIAVAEGQDASWRNARLSLIDYRGRTKSRDLWTGESPQDSTSSTSSGLFIATASPDGRWLAAGTSDGTILVWRGEELSAVVAGAASIVPSPSMRLEMSDFERCEGQIKESWVVARIEGSVCSPVWLSFAADSRRLAVSRLDGSVEIWDIESRTNVKIAPPGSESDNPTTCAFLGNGERLAVVRRRGEIQVLDSRDGHTIVARRVTPGDGFSARLVCSPDGELIPVVRGKDIELYHARDLSLAHRLSGHQRPVAAVAFSPNGKRLVSAAWDNSLKLWDLVTGHEVATLHGHEFRATCVLFLGGTIVSGGHDNQVRFWDATD